MPVLVAVEQATSFVGRLALLLMELTLAAAVIAGAVFVGHELREWREWYWALPPTFEASPLAPAVTEP
jgi:hypothetical protein